MINSDLTTNFFNNFHFIRPDWFFAAIPLLVLFIWLKRRSTKHSGWQSVIPPHLYSHMVVGKIKKAKRPPMWLLPFVWILTVVALAGPTWERLPQPVYQLKMGHVVVIDMSMSMRATDMTPDRLTRAKYKAIDLINTISEGEMGLVAYSGDAFVISPLTEDAGNITTLLPSLSPEIMPVPGSDPLLGIQAANDLLTNAGFKNGVIYWITDGIEFGQQKELQEYVSSMPFTLNALTVGTSEGAPIRQLNGELLKDTSGSIVIPKLNEGAVRSVTRANGGQSKNFTSNDDDIDALTSISLLDRDGNSGNDDENSESGAQGDQWREVGPYIAILLLPFAAYAFRRGLIFVIIFSLYVSMPITAPKAHAQANSKLQQEQQEQQPITELPSNDSTISWWQSPFLNSDQEGLSDYKQEKFKSAADKFESNSWKASALYKAGRYEEALTEYEKVSGADSLYNQGNALAKLGKLEASIKKYEEALQQEPKHDDAMANKALVEELLNQQQNQNNQQSQQNQSGDESNQSENQQQDNQSQSSDAQQNQENSNESQNGDEQDSESQNSEQQSSEQQNSDNQSEGQQNDQPQSPEQGEQSSQPSQSDQQNDQSEKGDTEQAEGSNSRENESEQSEEARAMQAQQEELTDAEKEEMQRMENLMRRVPDDPAFLLKRKMQLEAQKRKRERMPSNRRDW